jgi:chromosome segregation ATPase
VNKSELYTEGARLPEQLSRLIFLEGMIAGRRVLEVGARSSAVARFLLEQGATKVVCAVDDRALLERLRDENDLDRVDYRGIRPAGGSRPPGIAAVPVLPGDDGAFDLVIDFTLPEALAAGMSERLADIKRLLSPDGFALTALSSSPRGLGLLLDPEEDLPRRLSYRPLVDALKGTFELAQVYFQSMMLGYLFGSFDIEGGDEGIAPQTTLMGNDAEPAGAYVFAFGNAIPVIEDVCLVQVPFDALLDAVSVRRAQGSSPAGAAAFADRTELSLPPGLDVELAIAVRDRQIASLQQQVETLAQQLIAEDNVVDDVGAVVDGLARRLDEAVARALHSEQHVAVREVELVRALALRDELRSERDQLAEQLVGADADRSALLRRCRELEDELQLLGLRIVELEDAAIAADAQRSALQSQLVEASTAREHERLRGHAERELLQATITEHAAVVAELRAALSEAGLAPIVDAMLRDDDIGDSNDGDRRDAETSTVGGRVRSAIADRIAHIEQRAQRAEHVAATLEQQLAEARATLDDARRTVEEQAAAIAEANAAADVLDVNSSGQRHLTAALADAEAALARRTDDAVRLAAGVQRLVEERATIAQELQSALVQAERANQALSMANSRADSSSAEAAELRAALDEVRAAHDAATAAAQEQRAELDTQKAQLQTQLEHRRGHDQRQLEDARRLLEDARSSVFDLTAQRDVLQQALVARERELAAVGSDVGEHTTALEQLREQLQSRTRHNADLERAAEALSIEVRRLQAIVDDNGARLLTLQQERDALRDAVSAAEAARVAADDEARRLVSLVEEMESRSLQERQQWQAEREAEHQRALDALNATIEAANVALHDAQQALVRTLEAAREAAAEADAARTAVAAEKANHNATRDELAQATQSLLDLEQSVARARLEIEQRHIAAFSAFETQHAATVMNLRNDIGALQAMVDDAVEAAATANNAMVAARNDHAQLAETHAALVDVHTNAEIQRRAVGEDLAELQARHIELQQRLAAQLEAHAALEFAIVERDAALLNSEAAVAALTAEAETTAGEATEAERQIEDLRAALDRATAEHSAVVGHLEQATATDAERTATLQRVQTALEQAESEWVAAEERAAAAAVAAAAAEAERDALTTERSALIVERDALSQQLAEVTKRCEVLTGRLDVTMQQLEEVDEESQLAAERAYFKGVEQDKTITSLRAQVEELSAARDDAIAAHDAALASERDAHAAAVTSHAEQLAALQAAVDEAAAAEADARERLAQAEVRAAELQRAHDEHRAARTAHEHRIVEMQSQLDELGSQRFAADIENARRVAELQVVLDSAEAAHVVSLDEAERLKAALAAQVDAFASERAALTAALDDATQQAARHADALAAAQALLDDQRRLHAEGEASARAATVLADEAAAQQAEQLAAATARVLEQQALLDAERAQRAAADERAAALEAQLADERAQRAGQVEHHGAAVAELESLLSLSSTEAAEHRAALTAVQAQLEVLSQERDTHRDAVEARSEALAAAQASESELRARLESEQQAAADLARELAERQQALEQQTARADELNAQLTKTRSELKAAHTEHASAIAAHAGAMVAAEADTYAERSGRTAAELNAARLQQELELTGARLDTAVTSVEKATARLNELEQHIEAANAAATTAQARVSELQRALDDATNQYTLEAEGREALQARLDATVTEHAAALEQLVGARAAAADELDEARRRCAQLQTQLDEEASAAADTNTARLAVVAALATAQSDADALRSEVGTLTSSLSQLRSEHVDADARFAQAVARGDGLAATLEEAVATLARERARGDLLRSTLDEAQHEASPLQARVQHLLAVRDELLTHETAAASLSTQLEAERAQHATAQQRADEVEAQLVALTTAASTSARQRDELEAELATIRSALAAAEANAAMHAAAAQALQARLDDEAIVHTEVTSLNESISALRVELDAAERTVATLRADADDAAFARDEAGRVQQRHDAHTALLQETLDELREVTAREQARALLLEATLDEARSAWSRVDDELSDARRRNAALQEALLQAATPSSDADVMAQLRSELADALAVVESRATELAGVKDALLTAREDGRELEDLVNAHEARAEALATALGEHEAALQTSYRAQQDLVDEAAAAMAERDASFAELEGLRAAMTKEASQRAVLQDELAQARLELERALAVASQHTAADHAAEVALLREKLEAADKHLRARDEKIAEQAERINRLTERIVRNER